MNSMLIHALLVQPEKYSHASHAFPCFCIAWKGKGSMGSMGKPWSLLEFHAFSHASYTRVGIRNQDVLSEDLENDPFLNSALQRFTCELYYRFGSFLAPLSVGIITSRHYLSERNKNGKRENKNGGDEKTAE